ncbi:prostate-associated microseminoprotein [Amia ocellicauda]|uniref:prostate-associated microseminoprotein n=1 Tax=Amia ocellicauda TaxID=2972642 RepID=UPI0034640F28
MDALSGHPTFPLLLCAVLWTGSLAAPTHCYYNSKALCEHEGRQYSLGESWTDRGCLLCTCLHPVGVGCCDIVQRPVDFPAWCEVRVEPGSCQVTVVQSADPRLPCLPGGGEWSPNQGTLYNGLGG